MKKAPRKFPRGKESTPSPYHEGTSSVGVISRRRAGGGSGANPIAHVEHIVGGRRPAVKRQP